MGATRDYYADLELSPTADIQDVKKQFRKLGKRGKLLAVKRKSLLIPP
jgi:DnaJ-domain-containing protein 1